MEPSDLLANPAVLYEAYASRDRRFDGVFFVAVASTRIYCRPICPARTARIANCTFFINPVEAESAGYRACRRCRPERAPGRSTIDTTDRLIQEVTARFADGTGGGNAVGDIARELHVSTRHLRRIVQRELGVSPMEVVQTRRLLLARRLLAETDLPMTAVAEASGFSSLRRFNDAILKRYGAPPGALRQRCGAGDESTIDDILTIELRYRPPFDFAGTLAFLAGRALQGVEVVDEASYSRTVRLSGHEGWIRVSNAVEASALRLELSASLIKVVSQVIARVRRLFDLEADSAAIGAHLGSDALLGPSVVSNPGLRVPGAFDGFELALRAILGQQVTVRAAGTLAARVVKGFGDCVGPSVDGLERLSPEPQAIANADPEVLVRMGVLGSRARTIVDLARAVVDGRLLVAPGRPLDESLRALTNIRGIGPWTAQYIAMRALCWPDAFPAEDVALRKKLGGITSAQAESASRRWRPWRSYATMYLWRMV